jgi:hypothetical protein
VYALKYAAGRNWYGSEFLFGTAATYAKLPNLVVLTAKGVPIGGLHLELVPGQYGQLNAEIISEYDF